MFDLMRTFPLKLTALLTVSVHFRLDLHTEEQQLSKVNVALVITAASRNTKMVVTQTGFSELELKLGVVVTGDSFMTHTSRCQHDMSLHTMFLF